MLLFVIRKKKKVEINFSLKINCSNRGLFMITQRTVTALCHTKLPLILHLVSISKTSCCYARTKVNFNLALQLLYVMIKYGHTS